MYQSAELNRVGNAHAVLLATLQTYMRGVYGTDAGLSRERATNALFWDLFSSSSCRIEVMLNLSSIQKTVSSH